MTEATSPKTIAIVGGGLSGCLVATQLLRTATLPLVIYLIEQRDQIGQGVAYSTTVPNHVLNVPVAGMSAFPKCPTHFWQWLQSRCDSTLGYNQYSFVPRKLYGEYIQDVFREAEVNSHPFVRCQRIHDEAISLHLRNSQATLICRSGQNITAQKIVLALGNFPPSDPFVEQGADFYNHSAYIGYAWNPQTLRPIRTTDHVVLIGSGLTMIDIVVALKAQGHQGRISVVSRHGLLPQVHIYPAPNVHPPFLREIQPPQTMTELVKQVRQQVSLAGQKNRDWRPVIDSMRPFIPQIWQSLSPTERRRFLRHLRPYWDTHRHRVAPQVATLINSLLNTGQLAIYTGRIHGYMVTPQNQITVTLRQQRNTRLDLRNINWVINCTGPESDYRKFEQLLIVNLLKQGLACPDEMRLGLATTSNGSILNINREASWTLYTLGAPQKGILWETTAVPEIRYQAELLSQLLIQQLTE